MHVPSMRLPISRFDFALTRLLPRKKSTREAFLDSIYSIYPSLHIQQTTACLDYHYQTEDYNTLPQATTVL
jgi:hypothetical protein